MALPDMFQQKRFVCLTIKSLFPRVHPWFSQEAIKPTGQEIPSTPVPRPTRSITPLPRKLGDVGFKYNLTHLFPFPLFRVPKGFLFAETCKGDIVD